MEILTKFNLGETVWTLNESKFKIVSGKITTINTWYYHSNPENQIQYYIENAGAFTNENKCFKTKEELINYITRE